jgi:hypothetical protein
MITIRIGSETKNLTDYSDNWIAEQFNRGRHDSQSICAEVAIKTNGLDIRLGTPGCGGGGGSRRLPNGREQEVFDLWNKHRLNEPGFNAGNLIAFLKQLKRLVS